jgi:transposase
VDRARLLGRVWGTCRATLSRQYGKPYFAGFSVRWVWEHTFVFEKLEANVEKSVLELLLSQGFSVESIGKRFGRDPSTIAYWIHKHGLEAPNRAKYAAKGGIPEERLAELVERGMTIAEIAAELRLSKGTVRHWLRRFGLKTQNSRGRRATEVARAGREAGMLTIRTTCATHGETDFILEGRGYYRCRRCRGEAVARRRRKMKAILIAEAGGGCAICGYDRHPGALAFHHLDPAQKRLEINAKGVALSLNTLRDEARKCVLLCANCHAEVERGAVALPATVRGSPADFGRAP